MRHGRNQAPLRRSPEQDFAWPAEIDPIPSWIRQGEPSTPVAPSAMVSAQGIRARLRTGGCARDGEG